MRIRLLVAIVALLSSSPAVHAQTQAGEMDAADYLALVEQAAAQRDGPEGASWARRMAAEHERLAEALDRLIAAGREDEALRFVAAAGGFWDGEHAASGRQMVERVLSLPGAAAVTKERVRALYHAGVLAFRLRDQHAARERTRESVELARRIGDREAEVRSLASLARVYLRDGEHDLVRQHAEAALELAREIGYRRGEGSARHMLAFSALMQDDLDRAADLFHSNLRLGRELGSTGMVSVEAGNLAEIELRRGNLAEARRLLAESLELDRQAGNRVGMAYSLLTYGYIAAAEGDPALAVTLISAAEAAFTAMNTTMDPGNDENIARAYAEARAELGPQRFEGAKREGRALTLEDAVARAMGAN